MRIAYLDCCYGVTPGKLLAAIIDAGMETDILREEMKKLNIIFELNIKKEERGQNIGTKIELKTEEKNYPTTLNNIINLINISKVESEVKDIVKFIFAKIGKVESKIHGQPKEKVPLYEVGQPRAILTVTGIISGIKRLKIAELYCSEVSLGYGKVKCSHGVLSIPTPATSILIRNMPVFASNIKGELTTPLGAAIVSSLTKKFGKCPRMFIERIGHGFGSKDGPVRSGPLTIYTGCKI